MLRLEEAARYGAVLDVSRAERKGRETMNLTHQERRTLASLERMLRDCDPALVAKFDYWVSPDLLPPAPPEPPRRTRGVRRWFGSA